MADVSSTSPPGTEWSTLAVNNTEPFDPLIYQLSAGLFAALVVVLVVTVLVVKYRRKKSRRGQDDIKQGRLIINMSNFKFIDLNGANMGGFYVWYTFLLHVQNLPRGSRY